MRKELGRINSAYFGTDFERPYLYGLWLTFEGDGWGCGDGGVYTINVNPSAWNKDDRQNQLTASLFLRIAQLLELAGVASVDKLENLPVEVTFTSEGIGGRFESFRFLREVMSNLNRVNFGYLTKDKIGWGA
jgi:hypothetical protein